MAPKELLIISNNPLVKTNTSIPVDMTEGNCLNVMQRALHFVSCGYKLVSHPLSGSIKPNHNPYKSILLNREVNNDPDIPSIHLLHKSMLKAEQMIAENPLPDWSASYTADLQQVDLDLLLSAL